LLSFGGVDSSLIIYKNKPYINFNYNSIYTAQNSMMGRLYEIYDGPNNYNAYFNFEFSKIFTSCYIYNDKLYVYGGDSINTQFHEYDLSQPNINMNLKVLSELNLRAKTSAVIYNNYIYMLGGYSKTSSSEDNFTTSVYRLLIPAGESVSASLVVKTLTAPNEVKRKSHSSVLYNNSMYSVGGHILKDESVATNTLIKVNLDDFDNGIMTLTSLENCPKDIVDADAVCIGDKMYLLFGYQKSTESFNMDILVYDITNNTWSTDLTTTISLRYNKTIVRNNDIYIFGGENAVGSVDTIYINMIL
jgi:N-acetylneuraminic acid mutarotase